MSKKLIGGAEAAQLLKTGDVVEKRWTIEKVLGRGGFGAVYEVFDKQTGRHEAMKIELQEQDFRTLKLEVLVLKELNEKKARHVCQIAGMGKHKNFCYIVMTLVGPSFQTLLQSLKTKFQNGETRFGMRSVVHLGTKSLEALEDMHNAGYIHRDVKPQNYSVGRPPEYRRVFILDFGMCRKYLRTDGKQHRAREKAQFRGTLYYASVAALKGEDQSPRDDLWSWFFMLIRMTTGKVPWRDDVPARDMPMRQQAEHYAVAKQKRLNQPKSFLQGCPDEYHPMLSHLTTLQYQSKPDYGLCYKQFAAITKRLKLNDAIPLDWEVQGEHHAATYKAPAHSMMPNAGQKQPGGTN